MPAEATKTGVSGSAGGIKEAIGEGLRNIPEEPAAEDPAHCSGGCE